MAKFCPTANQRVIANAFSRNAQLLRSKGTLRRLDAAAGTRFDEPRIGQLVAHVASRQGEFGDAVVHEFRSGRFSAATGLLRPLLEMTAWIAWPFSLSREGQQKQRLVQLLLQGYRDARNRGVELPADVVRLLAETTGRSARKPVDFRQMLKDLDALERRSEDGTEYWVSHAENFELASQHVHSSLYGPFLGGDSGAANELLGVNALVYGHQYLAMSGVTCAIAADLGELKARIERRFASVTSAQHDELDRFVTNEQEHTTQRPLGPPARAHET